MAEAWLNDICRDYFEAHSAGLEPGKLSPLAVEAMREVGIDISKNKTQAVFDIFKGGELFAYAITVCAILFGLLPIMWSPTLQAGADVMKRIATPMIGGVITSAILELLLFPVIYVVWRKQELPDRTEAAQPLIPPALIPSKLR